LEELPTFKIIFNRNKQYLNVYLHDISHETFNRKGGGRWAYFQSSWESPRYGLFGELHFVKSRIREDVVSHELLHVLIEWMWSNGFTITRQNEERMCEFMDELVRKFYREYNKINP
jgi:hypothetical protein